MRTLVLIFIMLISTGTSALYAQENPLLSPKKAARKEEQPERKTSFESRYPRFISKALSKLASFQRQLRGKISAIARELKEYPSPWLLASVLGIAFIYGIAHALGPGHGKLLVISFFLSERPMLLKGLALGNIFAFLHSGSAVVLVLVLHVLFKQVSVVTAEETARYMMAVSYAVLTAAGLVLLIIRLRKKPHTHSHDLTSHQHESFFSGGIMSMALALGIVPCPGTTLLLLFSMSLGVLYLGIIIVAAMATGMAVTISLVGLITIALKRQTLSMLEGREHLAHAVSKAMEVAGAFFIFSIGLTLLLTVV